MRACLVLLLLTVASHAMADGIEWFPPEPGVGEPQVLMYMDFCGDSPPTGRPQLVLLDALHGDWELRFTHETGLACFATPPEGSARAYAFEMPERIDGIDVRWVRVVEHYFPGTDPVVTELTRPRAVQTPASITGTWQSVGAREQGLLITMDEKFQLVVSLNTYDAQSQKAWYSGVAYSANDVVNVPLRDTGIGHFMGTVANDAPSTPWGTLAIDWQTCGQMRVQWLPNASTGLSPGAADFVQLTGSGSAPCNLAAYAAGRNGRPEYVTYDIVR